MNTYIIIIVGLSDCQNHSQIYDTFTFYELNYKVNISGFLHAIWAMLKILSIIIIIKTRVITRFKKHAFFKTQLDFKHNDSQNGYQNITNLTFNLQN